MIAGYFFNEQKDSKTKTDYQNHTYTGNIWIVFASAMESKNLYYLIQNSLDTIQCAEYKLGIANINHLN